MLPLRVLVLSKGCISTSHNIIIFLLYVQFVLLAMLVVLLTYRAVSFSEHLQYMSVLDLDMADTVDFWCIMTKVVQGYLYIYGH